MTRTPTVTTTVVEADIDPVLGGELRVGNDAVVAQFPGGALSAAHRIRFEPTKPQAGQPKPNWRPILYAFSLRAFEKANLNKETTQFKKPVTIRVRYDPNWLKGENEKTLTLAYWDTNRKSWIVVPSTVDTRTHTVTAQTLHFTDYGLTTAPDIKGYMPSLENAQPDLFYGAASYSYGIEIPPGRHGFVPRLALSYSSMGVEMMGAGSQAPFVGAGWSFTTNYLARDTRDTYDSADDVFSLALNGAGFQLVRDAGDATLYHTWNKQYWQIKFDQPNDRWTVATEDGAQYQYGYSANSRAVQWRRDGDASHSRAETYAWWLEKAIDTHGNEIAYSYLHDTQTTNCYEGWGPYSYDAAIYPQFIRYNRQASGAYLTEIALLYSARTDYAAIGTNTQCAAPMQRSKLERINVSTSNGSVNQLVRAYGLQYDYSTFPGVWAGWATNQYGRLTLKNITQYGTDGTTALPTQVFNYQNNRLWQVQNGIGGAVACYEPNCLEPQVHNEGWAAGMKNGLSAQCREPAGAACSAIYS
ncbi:MAG: hypothetical protein HY782_14235 [Chloroflexi bacterium]|nr:hypothetical protein [Chloroflexota bacterium]